MKQIPDYIDYEKPKSRLERLKPHLPRLVKATLGAVVLLTLVSYLDAHANPFKEQPMIRIEIERNLPDDKSFLIVREFADLEELLMWFENKVETGGCDPYVDRVTMFPKGK